MCGIWCGDGDVPLQWLERRGPDHCGPAVCDNGDLLAFNGELFDDDAVPSGESDTTFLRDVLRECRGDPAEIARSLSRVRGPFAIVYYAHASRRLFLCRDMLGRRSLLTRQQPFAIASVADGASSQWRELPCTGVFWRSVDDDGNDDAKGVTLEPWPHVRGEAQLGADPVLPVMPMPSLKQPPHMELLERLLRSVRRRTTLLDRQVDGAPIGILFSGGLDCTVLAALADRCLPTGCPIDLLNFAFGSSPLAVPDRQTALNALVELRRCCPGREYRLVAIDVTLEDVRNEAQRLAALLHPHRTVMDMNLGAVLWFSSRGRGRVLHDSGHTTLIQSAHCRYVGDGGDGQFGNAVDLYGSDDLWRPYTSASRVLLSGLGADELFGGYGRHRTAFRRGGWPEAAREIDADFRRLHRRNLGRDDRLCADHGRDTLYPYLDRDVHGFVRALDLKQVARLDAAGGDKRILRQAAAELGLHHVARLQKRAIQFGTRIANRKVPGTQPLDLDDLHAQLGNITRIVPV
ncbi:hypothetical protein PBRA_000378 [Plasmodiophora brassicae]|uniref:Glutamine amidotransferase type-2 domain-containing protein n=1 Tax=Plasmodiophora brassicae TaxID=37360 RepID=A0A0G4IHD0_PLABS|nr:hypothetical protein PBRA_000378 [Plasmodiophora brassicae]